MDSKTLNFAQQIKSAVIAVEPQAKVILYGSRARGSATYNSDWDFIILLNKDKITYEDEMKMTDAIFPIGLENDTIISKFLYPKLEWENKYSITPVYKNVLADGITL